MNSNLKLALRRHSFNVLLGACAAGLSMPALAQTAAAAAVTAATSEMAAPAAAAAAPADDGSAATMATVQISSNKTRSSVALNSNEIQKILPGTNPLKALQTLPGVSFQTADPWGNNEQNLSLFVHGFSGQQLGYTMDGVPLGDQQYGNYNGLSPQRAVISENVRSVVLSSGAGDVGTASTSNLGAPSKPIPATRWLPVAARCSKRWAATALRAPMHAMTPVCLATATAPISRCCTTKRTPGISTAARAATRSTPNSSTAAMRAS